MAYFDVSVDAYVVQRHRALKDAGHKNASIYRLIAEELRSRRFPAPTLSERQIRRLIYG